MYNNKTAFLTTANVPAEIEEAIWFSSKNTDDKMMLLHFHRHK